MSDESMNGADEDPGVGGTSMSNNQGPGGMPSATEAEKSDDKSGTESTSTTS